MKKYQFLLVDDSQLAREAVKTILTNFPCDVVSAETGEQALELCNFTHFDLIMMDLNMPGKNGFEVTKVIRHCSFLNKNTPILALSVHGEAYLLAQIQRTQLNGLISKPFTHLNAAELINLLDEGTLGTPNRDS